MNTLNARRLLFAVAAILASCSSNDISSENASGSTITPELITFQLSTEFQGLSHPLTADVMSVMLADSASQDASQQWLLTPQGDGFFRIQNALLSEVRSMAVSSAVSGNQIQMIDTANNSSQLWQVLPLDNGFCRITSQLLGTAQSLDIVNDDISRELSFATSGNFTGQHWKLEASAMQPLDPTLASCTGSLQDTNPPIASSNFTPTEDYRAVDVRGFQVLVNPVLDAEGILVDSVLTELND